MKRCSACKIEKSVDEFNKNSRKKDGLQDSCRSCDNLANREWYQKNKQRALERVNRNNARYRKRGTDFLCEYLQENPCRDCGESDIVVLEFDHREAAEKQFNIADLVQRAGSLERLQREIDKCDVVCANCHRRRTAKRGGFYRIGR